MRMDYSTLASVMARYETVGLNREIHPQDRMWSTSPDCYWSVGKSALQCVLEGLAVTGRARDPGAILDLGCGYGRVGRHLRAAFPQARFYWCDVAGAEFCAERFGGEAIRSAADPAAVPLPFVDVIWVGSLFTHMTEESTRRWLSILAQRLNPEGVLIATFHGRTTLASYRSTGIINAGTADLIEEECRLRGWGYQPYRAHENWGFSITSITRLAEIGASVPGMRIGGIREAGWANNHDVLTLIKRQHPAA
jgi:SAM-dependent methyltransferase